MGLHLCFRRYVLRQIKVLRVLKTVVHEEVLADTWTRFDSVAIETLVGTVTYPDTNGSGLV